MIFSDTTDTDARPAAELAAFGAFLAARRTAMLAAAAQSPTALLIPEAQRSSFVERTLDLLIDSADDGAGIVVWCTVLLRERAALGLSEMQTHVFVDAVRGPVLDTAFDALVAGVPYAREGTHALLGQIDALHQSISRLFHEAREAEMRRMTTRLDQILTTTPLSSVEWAKDGSVVRWNPAAERIFGWTAEEAVGRNIVQLLVPDVALEHVQMIVDILLSGEGGTSSRNVNVRKDGQLITCQWYNAVLRNDQGEIVGALSQTEDVTEEIRAEEALRESQDQLIMAQQAALRELSTPLIPLDNGVVAMPLIGAIDSTRAQQVIETLLEGVSYNQARVAILDITGVSVVDTQVANALIRAAQAVKLLGARVVLTGIRPEVAQTLVGLGVDLAGIVTRSSLQAGIQYALNAEALRR